MSLPCYDAAAMMVEILAAGIPERELAARLDVGMDCVRKLIRHYAAGGAEPSARPGARAPLVGAGPEPGRRADHRMEVGDAGQPERASLRRGRLRCRRGPRPGVTCSPTTDQDHFFSPACPHGPYRAILATRHDNACAEAT
jgi:hypothetical protein